MKTQRRGKPKCFSARLNTQRNFWKNKPVHEDVKEDGIIGTRSAAPQLQLGVGDKNIAFPRAQEDVVYVWSFFPHGKKKGKAAPFLDLMSFKHLQPKSPLGREAHLPRHTLPFFSTAGDLVLLAQTAVLIPRRTLENITEGGNEKVRHEHLNPQKQVAPDSPSELNTVPCDELDVSGISLPRALQASFQHPLGQDSGCFSQRSGCRDAVFVAQTTCVCVGVHVRVHMCVWCVCMCAQR